MFESVKPPPDTVLLPGVISHATNIVEHPDTIADRIVRFAELVGRENGVASTDCGFSSQVREIDTGGRIGKTRATPGRGRECSCQCARATQRSTSNAFGTAARNSSRNTAH